MEHVREKLGQITELLVSILVEIKKLNKNLEDKKVEIKDDLPF